MNKNEKKGVVVIMKNKWIMGLALLCLLMLFFLLAPFSHAAGTWNKEAQSIEELRTLFSSALEEKVEELIIKYTITQGDFYLDDIGRLVQTAVNEQNPYIKNTIDSWDINVASMGNQVDMEILFYYLSTREEDLLVYQEVKTIIEEIISPEMNAHQKVKAIYDEVVERVAYDFSYTNYSAYEALVEGKAVCQGFALLTYQMLKEAGLESTIVRGEMIDELHGWNLVQLDKQWYHLDTTQDATHYHQHGDIPYNHYGLNDAQIGRTHWWIREEYPPSTGDYLEVLQQKKNQDPEGGFGELIRELNLHYLLEEYTAYDQERHKELIKEAVLQKKPAVSFRSFDPFYDAQVFSTIFQELVNENPELGQSLAGYGALKRNFPRDHYSNSMILTLTFRYHE